MIGRVLALALATTVMVRADNCAKASAAYRLMSNVTGKYCNGGNANTCTENDCVCNNCCEMIPDTCIHWATTKPMDSYCGVGKMVDQSKAAMKVGTGTYKATCCKDAPTTPNNTCATKMAAQMAAMPSGQACSGDKPILAAATMNSEVAADLGNYGKICCVMKKKCDVTCSAGMKQKSAYATTECNAEMCMESECCEIKPGTCRAVSGGANSGYQKCVDANMFVDGAKFGTAAKEDGTDFKDMCCTMLATCSAFKDATTGGGDTAAATQQHAATVSLLFAVVGGLSF